jgi:hypothetical protein
MICIIVPEGDLPERGRGLALRALWRWDVQLLALAEHPVEASSVMRGGKILCWAADLNRHNGK